MQQDLSTTDNINLQNLYSLFSVHSLYIIKTATFYSKIFLLFDTTMVYVNLKLLGI